MSLTFVLFSVLIFQTTVSLHLKKNTCPQLWLYPLRAFSRECAYDPNVVAKTPQLIESRGYEVRSYYVTTVDGYILQLYRIISGFYASKTPIFLMHGLALDSGCWLIPGKRSIAFNLAARGYDVWLANNRGTQYSRSHLKLSPDDQEYWNYNMDTMAVNDIPAALEKVSEVTGKAGSIIYIGHSRGSTIFFMWASERPKEAQKYLSGMIALSPVVYFQPNMFVAPVMKLGVIICKFLLSFGYMVMFRNTKFALKFLQFLYAISPWVGLYVYRFVMGFWGQLKPRELLLTAGQMPSTLEMTSLLQYCQHYVAGKFQKFDYGEDGNLEYYGIDGPPKYDLGNIKIPLYLINGRRDSFVSVTAARRVFQELGSENKVLKIVPEDEKTEKYQFNHQDLLWGKYVNEFVLSEILVAIEDRFRTNQTDLN